MGQRIAAFVIPERRSLIRDRNNLKRQLFAIPARASLAGMTVTETVGRGLLQNAGCYLVALRALISASKQPTTIFSLNSTR